MAVPRGGRPAAVDPAALHDFSLWVQTDFNYARPGQDAAASAAPAELGGAHFHAHFDPNMMQAGGAFAAAPGKVEQGTASFKASEDSDDDEQTSDEKRRRNSAASARHRLKKKLKEQKLEQAARTLTERADYLQRRVHMLEAEVAYLRELIVIRHDRDREEALAAAADRLRDAAAALEASHP